MWSIHVDRLPKHLTIYLLVSHNDLPLQLISQQSAQANWSPQSYQILHWYRPTPSGPHTGAGLIKSSVFPSVCCSTEVKTTHWFCQTRTRCTWGDGVVQQADREWQPPTVIRCLPCSLVLHLAPLSDVFSLCDVWSPGKGCCATDFGTDWYDETHSAQSTRILSW